MSPSRLSLRPTRHGVVMLGTLALVATTAAPAAVHAAAQSPSGYSVAQLATVAPLSRSRATLSLPTTGEFSAAGQGPVGVTTPNVPTVTGPIPRTPTSIPVGTAYFPGA